MPRTRPNQALRARIETGIGLVAPLLDLLLAVGDRVSRVLAREDPDHVPVRVSRPGEYARPGLSLREPTTGSRR